MSACAQGIVPESWEQSGPEATPVASWFGSTGLVVIPTAYVLDPATAQVEYHHINADNNGNPALQIFGGNVGVTSDLEVGVTRFQGIETGDSLNPTTSKTALNAKYHLQMNKWLNSPDMPDVAVGVFDVTNQFNRAWYVVASKQVNFLESGPTSLGLHLGYARNEARQGALDGIFGGVDFVPFKNLIAQAEYDSNHFNAAVRYFPTKWFSLDLSSVDSNFGWGATGVLNW
jgi:hypothetical protein